MRNQNPIFIGLGLGQAHDYTALVAVERHTGGRSPEGEAPAEFHVRHLQRFPLGTSYPQIATAVKELLASLASPSLGGRAPRLVCDATGVGLPVVALLREKGLRVTAVLITGGDAVTNEGEAKRVPKRDLVATVQVLLQNRQLKFAASLPELAVLKAEMQAFKAKVTITAGHDTYEAWRERDHDDLVLALALACYEASRPVTPHLALGINY